MLLLKFFLVGGEELVSLQAEDGLLGLVTRWKRSAEAQARGHARAIALSPDSEMVLNLSSRSVVTVCPPPLPFHRPKSQLLLVKSIFCCFETEDPSVQLEPRENQSRAKANVLPGGGHGPRGWDSGRVI